MTINEMNDKIQEFCNNRDIVDAPCEECPLRDICDLLFGDFGEENPEETKEAYEVLCNIEQHDNVNHPKHYCREDGMECIDEMVLVFGRKAVMTYCLLNVWKYRYRAADKNGAEDLKKSDWYMRKYDELKKQEDAWE